MGAGRPRKINSPEDMQQLIDNYFSSCKGEILKDKDGNVVLDKYNKPIVYDEQPLTMNGLALAIGFNSRQSLFNYVEYANSNEEDKKYLDVITRARAIVEQYAEKRLFDKDGNNGAKFWLASNGKGWTDKQDVSISNGTITVQLSDEE